MEKKKKKTWSKKSGFLFFLKVELGDFGCREYTEKWAEGFFLLFTLSLFKRNERKFFIPYQKRDEKGNQSNAQWSRKSSGI